MASAQPGPSVQTVQVAEDLAALRLRYGPRHPDVLTLEARARVAARTTGQDSVSLCAHLARREQNLLVQDLESSQRFGPLHPRRVELRTRIEVVRGYRATHCAGS